MRERLIELHEESGEAWNSYLDACLENKEEPGKTYDEFHADYLLANGVIVPPCKVGDMVYCLDDIVYDSDCEDCKHYWIGGFGDPSECERTRSHLKHPGCIKIEEKSMTQRDILCHLFFYDFGKTVFLTREEAEKALAERRINNG